MYFPGTCPDCNIRGLEAHLAQPIDYLECAQCGWRSDRKHDEVTTVEAPVAAIAS